MGEFDISTADKVLNGVSADCWLCSMGRPFALMKSGGLVWVAAIYSKDLLDRVSAHNLRVKVMITQLLRFSYSNARNNKAPAFLQGLRFVWCRHQESNPGPTDYKSVALPTELYRRVGDDYSDWVGSVNP